MRLLHVISSTNPKGGGPVEGITQLQAPLRNLGIITEVVCCDAPGAPWLKTSPLSPIHPLGPGSLKYGYSYRLVPWLKENARHYDCVVVNGIWQYHSFAGWLALHAGTVPYFVFTHGMLDPWFKYTYPLKHLKKWLYWPWSDYRLLRDAKAVIFTCEEERLLARESFWLYRANEAVTSYGTNEPPQNKEALSAKFFAVYPELNGKKIILFLSRIHEKKGCDLLVEAFAAVAPMDNLLHLVMTGPDQIGWEAELRARAAQFGIAERITWTGMLQGDMKWGAFYASNAFCLPSHQENFGIVVAEALACGKPVLISNRVNIWREIEADGAGFIDTDTAEGTLRNLKRWLALDFQAHRSMSCKARQCFLSRFHIDHAAKRLKEIFKSHGLDPDVGELKATGTQA